ncbi:MAG: hypothetical protein IKD07_04625 [Clostridia bacterium]|nr:hypothetical protein [Clostridia bacterium]
MKKVLAFLLALSMCLIFVTGCTKIAGDDPAARGAVFDVYLGKKVMNLDPAIAYTDDEAVKIISLIFEGLFKLDEKGNLKKALAKKWEITEDPKTGEERLEITIKDTYWSCGSAVQANDVVFAWRRILDPNFDSPAASMLYCIKGAKQVKSGEISPYDPGFGLYAEKSNKIIVEFEEGADIQEFLYNLSSPALVPLRENKVTQYPEWSRSATDLSTNGPFRVKKFSEDPAEHITLERSRFYYLNQEVATEAKDKYVTPYQINIRYDVPATDVKTMYDNKELFYVSGLTAATAADYGKNVQIEDVASAFMFYFNFGSEVFEDAAVRKAFSLALNRDAIAGQLGLGTTPATGILNDKVFNTKKGNSFREKGGAVVASNVDEAKAVLTNAGIDPADYDTVYVLVKWDENNDGQGSYKSNETVIVDAAIEAWRALGFDVEPTYATSAQFELAYATGDYDVIGMDYQMISANPLYDLAMFSAEYSKTGSLLSWYQSKYVGGERVFEKQAYVSEEFEKLLAEAFNESDLAKRAEILHNAEKALIEDGALIPVVFNANAYVVSPELKRVKTNYWGVQNFQKANLKNYVQYLPSVRGVAASSDEE